MAETARDSFWNQLEAACTTVMRCTIRKDIISTLMDHGHLNQSRLISRCNLNYAKHRGMLDDLVEKEMISRSQRKWGNSFTIEYRITEKGIQFLSRVMQPYENMFPRESASII